VFSFPRASEKLPTKLATKVAITVISTLAGAAIFHSGMKSISKSTNEVDVRTFDHAVSITVNRTSPAFAALEDTLEDFDDTVGEYVGANLSPYAPAELLMAGSNFADRAQQIIADNSRIASENVKARAIADAKANENVRKLQAFLQSAFAKQAKPAAVEARAPEPIEKVSASESEIEPGMLVVSGGQILEPSKFAATSTEDTAEVKTIRLAELKIDKQELLKSLFLPLVTAAPGNNKPAAAAAGTRGVGGLQKGTRSFGHESGQASAISTDEKPKGMLSPRDVTTQAAQPHMISGSLEMLGGLAVTSGKDQLVVYREIDGERLESASVYMREARYKIYVNDNEGILVAELYAGDGYLLGRGEYELGNLSRSQDSTGINLRLGPIARGISGRVQSAYSYGDKVDPVAGAEVFAAGIETQIVSAKDGTFTNENIAVDSVLITKTQRPNYWGTLAFARSGSNTSLTLFPDKMMSAFSSLAGFRIGERPPVIWGKVTQSGRAVAGAKVELLTAEASVQPVYFNALMIPDPSLTVTSANGMYAFIPVEPGVQVIQASMGGDTLEPVIVAAEAGFVSTVDLEVKRTQQTTVKVFDAFEPSQPLGAEIRVLGNDTPRSIDPSGTLQIRTAPNNSIVAIDADAGDKYAITRITVNGAQHSLNVPMVKQSWIDDIQGSKRISRQPNTGVAVGFVTSNQRFQVFASGNSPSNEIRIVYFNRSGRVVNTNYGAAGGGYIAYNLPEGFSTLSVVAERVQGAQVVTTLVEKTVTNVITHSLK
jgi:hypothetical protein